METAANYLAANLVGAVLDAPKAAHEFVRQAVGGFEMETFGTIWLDNRHRVLAVDQLFRGTIDGASVHPREVVKAAIAHNAAAAILFHNHPSGTPDPSHADEMITRRLRDALALIDVRVLDHIIAAKSGVCSFAEKGLL